MKKAILSKLNSISTMTKNVAITTGVATGAVLNVVTAHATEGTVTLDPSITAGFTTAGTNTLLIIAAGVTACVAVIAAAGGAKAGLKWIKGVFAKAS